MQTPHPTLLVRKTPYLFLPVTPSCESVALKAAECTHAARLLEEVEPPVDKPSASEIALLTDNSDVFVLGDSELGCTD